MSTDGASRVLDTQIDALRAYEALSGDELSGPTKLILFGRPHHGQWLDVGCGPGTIYSDPRTRPTRLSGIDGNLAALEIARRSAVNPIASDISRALPIRPGCIDTVVLFDVLEHVYYPSQLVSEARDTLRNDGAILVMVPNHFDLPGRVSIVRGSGIVHRHHRASAKEYFHIRFLRDHEWRAMFEESGLKVVQSHYFFFGTDRYPYRLLPSGLRKALVRRWPDLFSPKFGYELRKVAAPEVMHAHAQVPAGL